MNKVWRTATIIGLAALTAAACNDDTGPEDTGIGIDVTVVSLPAEVQFDVLINGAAEFTVNSSGLTELTVEGIPEGTYVVTLGELPAICDGEPAQHTLTLDEGEFETVAFTVTCLG